MIKRLIVSKVRKAGLPPLLAAFQYAKIQSKVHQETLKEIVGELVELLPGHFLGKIFQLSTSSIAFDFGVRQEGYLFISVDPGAPRLYLINRGSRELEKVSIPLTQFALTMRAALGGGRLASLTKDADERIVRFLFSVEDELGDSREWTLVAQLTGRSANLFLLDAAGKISQALRATKGEGQQPAEIYQPPATQTRASASVETSAASGKLVSEETPIALGNAASLSEAADKHYRRLDADREFDNLAGTLVGQLKKEITKRKKLQANLRQDLVSHGNPDEHKRLGDLLLANLSSARRTGNKVSLADYYADGSPTIEVEVDENATLQETAGKSFSRYTKAKRAVEEINARLRELNRELAALDEKRIKLDEARINRDPAALAQFSGQKPQEKRDAAGRKKPKTSPTLPGMRRYLSSDGYEVLVGRTARNNDQLTFRVARPNDLWLHTSDYPGSHVIVRNSSRS